MVNIVDDTEPIDISLANFFGINEIYPEGQTAEDWIFGLLSQMSSVDGIAENIHVYLGMNSTMVAKCALYRASDNSLVGETVEKTLDFGMRWEEFIFNEPKPQLVANEMYYICAWALADPGAGIYCAISYEEGVYTPGIWFRSQTYGAWPNPISLSEWGTARGMSIYCNYTPTT